MDERAQGLRHTGSASRLLPPDRKKRAGCRAHILRHEPAATLQEHPALHHRRVTAAWSRHPHRENRLLSRRTAFYGYGQHRQHRVIFPRRRHAGIRVICHDRYRGAHPATEPDARCIDARRRQQRAPAQKPWRRPGGNPWSDVGKRTWQKHVLSHHLRTPDHLYTPLRAGHVQSAPHR